MVYVFASLPWFPIILACPRVILGLPQVASPVLDVCATAPRWPVVINPFSVFASRRLYFPMGRLLLSTRPAKHFSLVDSRPNPPNTPILPLKKT